MTPDPISKKAEWDKLVKEAEEEKGKDRLKEKAILKKLSFGMSSKLIEKNRKLKVTVNNAQFDGYVAFVGIGKKKPKV